MKEPFKASPEQLAAVEKHNAERSAMVKEVEAAWIEKQKKLKEKKSKSK